MFASIVAACIATCALTGAAEAIVTYEFNFTNIKGENGGTAPDFNITLDYSGYVTTTGLQPLLEPQPTTLGYDINNAGTTSVGLWGFDGNGKSLLTETDFFYGPESFLFDPVQKQNFTYFTAPGVYAGTVSGNASFPGFTGDAMLTITQSSIVPEPASPALFGLGMAGLALRRSRRA